MVIDVTFLCYETPVPCQVLTFDSPANILGMDALPTLFGAYLPLKNVKCLASSIMPSVTIEPVVLPPIPPSFTAQYPLKGGHEEVTATLQTLIERGIIERTSSFNYNSPIWPVRKPNGSWRFTVDYRNINKLSPPMPGQLPDVEAIFNSIREFAPTIFVTIDLTDMFFAIPLAEESRDITTFTWDAQQYRFTRLPQGYRNSPIIAHNALQTCIPWSSLPTNVKLFSYVDDILLCAHSAADASTAKETLIKALQSAGWAVNPDKVHGPAEQVKFLGVLWSTTGPTVPPPVLDKLLALPAPTNKSEAQHLIGMFGYWRHHIPYLQVILQPIYKVTRKASDFCWDIPQKTAFDQAKEYISLYSQLFVPQQGDTIVLDILFLNGYGSWGVYAKSTGVTRPVGFYCKRFPFSPNKYSLFEKYVWTLTVALQHFTFELHHRDILIRTPVPILDWIKMPDTTLQGLPMEPKVLTWKWFLQNLLADSTTRSSQSAGRLTELLATSPMAAPPNLPPERSLKPIGRWGASTPSTTNVWYTDGSATVRNGTTFWKAAAYRPSDGCVLSDQGTDSSAQIAELCAVLLAVRHCTAEGHKVIHIFSDSWSVCNGIAIWSAKWMLTDFCINGKPVWGQEWWKELANSHMTILVTHVDAHTGKTDVHSSMNEVVDKLAKTMTLKLVNTAPWTSESTGDLKVKIKRKPNWTCVSPKTTTLPVSPTELTKLHVALGHTGTHALYRWCSTRNIKASWQACKHAIRRCTSCPNMLQRFRRNPPASTSTPNHFNHTVQIDFIGPLRNKHFVCTMVDTSTGLGTAIEAAKANQGATIFALWNWVSHFGTPIIIESDQGTHFTGAQVQKLALELDIQWNFHLSYNPTASGFVERFNGLLKQKLEALKDYPFHIAIRIALYELNNRCRLHRNSPFAEVFTKDFSSYPSEPSTAPAIPSKVVHKDRKDSSLKVRDIVASGPGNSYWTSGSKGELSLVKARDITPVECSLIWSCCE